MLMKKIILKNFYLSSQKDRYYTFKLELEKETHRID